MSHKLLEIKDKVKGNVLQTIGRFTLHLFLLIMLFAFGCSQKSEYTEIDLSNRQPITDTASRTSEAVFRVAIAGVVSPTETLESYSELVSYLGQELHQPVEIVQRSTYAEINDLVRSGYIDLAFVCSLAYVLGNEEFDMQLLVVPEVEGATIYYSYIIVPADSTVETMIDLRGKVFAFTDPLSNSGRLSPTYILQQMGDTPENFFDKYIFTYSHDNSIRAVADRLVDGAAVDSLVYDHIVNKEPRISTETRIIHVSPPYGIPPLVTHPALDPEIRARLRGLLLNINQVGAGKEILDDLNIERFVLGDDASYDMIRLMRNELR
jgi:phosphonate transport system substrate-binding protein